jgi:hypothetical protein
MKHAGSLVHESHVFNSAQPGKEFLAIQLAIGVAINALNKLPTVRGEIKRFELRKRVKVENDMWL